MSDKPKTIVLGLDSFDWQIIEPLIEQGQLPNLAKLKAEGAYGDLATLDPTISPILWNSIATGKRAGKHGIHGFTEVDPVSERVRPVSSLSRSCKAIWNLLMQENFVCHVLNWFASHPAEPLSGSCVSDLYMEGFTDSSGDCPLTPETVFPVELEGPLAELRIGLDEIPGDLIKLLVPDAAKVDQSKDRRLSVLATELAKAYSVHAAATWILENRRWDFLAVYWRTPDLLKHYFMPFHPPAVKGVSDEGAAMYGCVVAGIYRLFDQIIGRYVELIPSETNLILLSDHGFQSGALRPSYNEDPFRNPEAWHRPQGVFLAKGPGIVKKGQTFGARLLDITPTLLVLNGVQPAFDMDGRVLTEILSDPMPIDPVDSYEETGGATGMHPPGKAYTFPESDRMVQQFVDLGYIAPLNADRKRAAEQTRNTNKNQLARDYLDEGRPGLALPLLEELNELAPNSIELAAKLAYAQRQLGLVAEAEKTLQDVCRTIKEGPVLKLLRAEIHLDKGDFGTALRLLETIQKEHGDEVHIQGILGRTYHLMGDLASAKECLERALERDPDDARALQGLALAALKQRNYTETLDYALQALGKKPDLYYSHYYLGVAADKLGFLKEAIQALKSSLNYGPRNRTVHLMLARLLKKAGNEEESNAHRRTASILLQLAKKENERIAQLRDEVVARSRKRQAEKQDQAAGSDHFGGQLNSEKGAGTQGRSKHLDLVLVSGIPRSGTSLMMQILDRGGLKPLHDNQRKADESNQEGYFELELIKDLKNNPRAVEKGEGKATKVISMLLPYVPSEHHYRVIYMRRDPLQVAKSQARMLSRMGKEPAYLDPSRVAGMISRHDEATLRLLREADNICFIEVRYEDLIERTAEAVERVKAFLGDVLEESVEHMSGAVNPSLWRER